ncbi:3-deoxy-manno-octulosonate cytidylyltransferase (CMP-KDO synthetase) [Acetomicrobium flavidum]|uniref:3-deoxy-manno-octulosonate cytidylyltransferase n=1 Tax=Acetomicrobium flavidum TaxID=49896 RepID=A0ABY1JCC3_9BACT|nr:3-deoxy-manno-octulosonate cytidylyltransferase (CMP-KDO synthetase) [Acetomicrobium flavidum]
MSNRILAVVPARYGSTRLQCKPLMEMGGRPLLSWVLKGLSGCNVDDIAVATDHEDIAALARKEGFEAIMTPSELPSGSNRTAWVARRKSADIVLNVQVDDPMVGPDMIDPLVEALGKSRNIGVALLAKRIENADEVSNPNVVKVVFDRNMRALYFSRSPIPYERNKGAAYFKHIGPYCYRRQFLLEFDSWPQTPLEKIESLEMLRILEMGFDILCVESKRDTIEIDTQEDVLAFEKYLREHGDELPWLKK